MQRGSQKARVLVADDDPSIRQLLCTIVRREHYEATCVADGGEAIEKLKESSYAVILLDLMMPRVNGFDVIDYLKEHPPAIKPIVLVISAYADQKFKDVDASIVAGVLRKPFEIADLGGLIRLCISGFDQELSQMLDASRDRAVRELARKNSLRERPNDRNGESDGAPN